jgi:hypothetical protein
VNRSAWRVLSALAFALVLLSWVGGPWLLMRGFQWLAIRKERLCPEPEHGFSF